MVAHHMYRLRRGAEAQAARTESLNLMLVAQVEETQRLNSELRALNEDLVSLTVAADSARDAAEHANRAKSDFLAVMSHELRTPLNAIAGYVELLSMGLHGPVTEAQASALGRVKRNQEHLLRLINDILQFATLQAGKIEVYAADLSVEEVLASVEAMILPQAGDKGICYRSRAPQVEARVRGDPERISQILLNLVGNAVKFTPAGGTVAVRCEVGEETVAFHVSDTGRGIPADRLQSIFEPFVQVRSDAADDPSRQGVGLGLAISRELARAMGGELEAKSREGEGSTFTLTLLRGRRQTTSIVLLPEGADEIPTGG
jgi:signal transduction histidine kinase